MTNIRSQARLFLLIVGCLGSAPTAASEELADEIDSGRVAWRYTQKDLTVTIRQSGGKEWVAERSDGNRPVYDEIKRTDDYIELQNRETRLFIRLQVDQAYWRRPKDQDWTSWVKGSWISEEVKPAGKPSASNHRVRLAYFVPRGRKPVANYQQKISVVMAIVAELYEKDLSSKGYKTTGFKLETKDNKPVIHLVAVSHPGELTHLARSRPSCLLLSGGQHVQTSRCLDKVSG